MDVLERRIASGEYMLKNLPGERKIAEEVGVSYMTARKAVLKLIEKEVLTREANGSLIVHPKLQQSNGTCQVALLTPAYPSTHLMRCRLEIARAIGAHDIQFRAVEYTHWDDSIVHQAIENSDGVIVIPLSEPIPARTLRTFTEPGKKVVFYDADMTDHRIPSVRLYAREHIWQVFEHLWALGHRRVDCLNTQGRNDEIERRIDHWRSWLDERGGTGGLWDDPARPYEDPIERAHRHTLSMLHASRFPATAIVCTTQPAALGAIRAAHDLGIRVSEDLSVCTINNEPTGRYFCPSLTGLEMPDTEELLEQCIEWFADPGNEWIGDLRIVPDRPRLFVGESTGPVRAERG